MEIAARPLLAMPIAYALCLSRKDYKKALTHFDIKSKSPWLNPGKNATAHTFENDQKTVCIVCLKLQKDKSQSQIYGLLVHEGVHIWQEVRAMLGEEKPSTEFEAYAIQGISQELIEMYEIMTGRR